MCMCAVPSVRERELHSVQAMYNRDETRNSTNGGEQYRSDQVNRSYQIRFYPVSLTISFQLCSISNNSCNDVLDYGYPSLVVLVTSSITLSPHLATMSH